MEATKMKVDSLFSIKTALKVGVALLVIAIAIAVIVIMKDKVVGFAQSDTLAPYLDTSDDPGRIGFNTAVIVWGFIVAPLVVICAVIAAVQAIIGKKR